MTDKVESQEFADTARATYDQAVAALQAAEAQVKAAEASIVSTQKQVEVAKTQLDGSSALVQQAEAALAQAKLNLDHTQIRAPVDGIVQSRNMDVGQTVAASFQAPTIFLIAQDLTKMQVDTNVDEADVGPIRLKQPATFTVDAYPGQMFAGEMAQIRQAPINVQNVITYDVVVDVKNPDLKLFPGMTANVTIVTGHASNVLRIPKAALRFRPTGSTPTKPGPPGAKGAYSKATFTQTIYILDGRNSIRSENITVGVSDTNFVELKAGNVSLDSLVVLGTARPGSSSRSVARSPSPLRGSDCRGG